MPHGNIPTELPLKDPQSVPRQAEAQAPPNVPYSQENYHFAKEYEQAPPIAQPHLQQDFSQPSVTPQVTTQLQPQSLLQQPVGMAQNTQPPAQISASHQAQVVKYAHNEITETIVKNPTAF